MTLVNKSILKIYKCLALVVIDIYKAAKPVGAISNRKDGKYKKTGPREWEKVKEEKETEDKESEKKDNNGNPIAINYKKAGLEYGEKLPEDTFLHGSKNESNDLDIKGDSIYLSDSWDIANNYSKGNDDNIKVIKLSKNAKIANMENKKDRDIVAKEIYNSDPDSYTLTEPEIDEDGEETGYDLQMSKEDSIEKISNDLSNLNMHTGYGLSDLQNKGIIDGLANLGYHGIKDNMGKGNSTINIFDTSILRTYKND